MPEMKKHIRRNIRRMYDEGVAIDEIASHYQINYHEVANVIREEARMSLPQHLYHLAMRWPKRRKD